LPFVSELDGVDFLAKMIARCWSTPGMTTRMYRLIISNPPYICTSVLAELAPEVRDHDPRQALDGGADGLSAYRDIIARAARHMKTGAHLVFEIGYDQKTAVSRLLETSGFTDLQQVRDLGGNDRAIAATKT
ncbi:MAG: protein-(glutamine-N5) methyltransferase, release factor-specific, partial [Pseudomonadota bacterium]|nr:protein-(glutamine-N5) methyltransferase, release factor-specific [Pseudomonadota bacterium]